LTRAERIAERLERELAAEHVAVEDESHEHAGHAGAKSGGGHFRATIVSARFAGLSRIAAQRLVYAALGELMAGEIHAIAMTTYTPEEWRNRAGVSGA
jgi:BolA family transcriptional regulator, general stress-responsive regulator